MDGCSTLRAVAMSAKTDDAKRKRNVENLLMMLDLCQVVSVRCWEKLWRMMCCCVHASITKSSSWQAANKQSEGGCSAGSLIETVHRRGQLKWKCSAGAHVLPRRRVVEYPLKHRGQMIALESPWSSDRRAISRLFASFTPETRQFKTLTHRPF